MKKIASSEKELVLNEEDTYINDGEEVQFQHLFPDKKGTPSNVDTRAPKDSVILNKVPDKIKETKLELNEQATDTTDNATKTTTKYAESRENTDPDKIILAIVSNVILKHSPGIDEIPESNEIAFQIETSIPKNIVMNHDLSLEEQSNVNKIALQTNTNPKNELAIDEVEKNNEHTTDVDTDHSTEPENESISGDSIHTSKL